MRVHACKTRVTCVSHAFSIKLVASLYRISQNYHKVNLIWKGKFADPFYFNALAIDFE